MIDLTRKVIFTHPHKCGGTTIEALFGWHPSTSSDQSSEYGYYFRSWKHASLDLHIRNVNQNGMSENDFFIFSCVRNPWDRAVSLYYYRKHQAPQSHAKKYPTSPLPNEVLAYTGMNFENFINGEYLKFARGGKSQLSVASFVSSSKGRTPDYIIRYEEYKAGLEYVAGLYGLDSAAIKPYNANFRPKGVDYKSYYTDSDLISKVADIAKDSIDIFGYCYD
jgi:hypothetical protein